MPQAFLNCIKRGGRVSSKSLKGDKYVRICYLNGKSYTGEVKTKKTHKSSSKKRDYKNYAQ